MNRITYFSLALLVAFFLPWFNLFFFNISGFDLPTSLDKLSEISGFFNNGKISKLNPAYFLYLIPVFSIINLIGDFNKKNRYKLINEFSVGLLFGIYIIYVLLERKINLTTVLAIGFYLTILFSVIGLFFVQIQNSEKNEMPNNKKVNSTEIEDKKDLFNQIEKLHKLNTDGVINDDVFKFEKSTLLEKIDEINLKSKSLESINIVETNSYEKEESFFSKYKLFIIIGIISLVILSFCYNNYNSKQRDAEIISTNDSINKNIEEVTSTDEASSIESKHYLEILKKYLEKISKKNNEIKKVYINEDGNLRTEDIDGNKLSVYGLIEAEIFSGDVNNDAKSETIISITNSGGGGGGNIETVENYLIVNDKVVSEINMNLINAPENEFGYSVYLSGIKDGYVMADFIYKNEEDGFYAQGKKEKLKCKLVDNKLKVEN